MQVRRHGLYRSNTFDTKREAKDWSTGMESKANHVSSSGFSPIPKGATVQDLIEKYSETVKKTSGRTKAATLEMLKRQIGKVQLTNLNALVLRDFIDRRSDDGAGGVTIAADLSYLSAVLKWARHARQLDINDRLALDARASLTHRGLKTRSQERSREPSDEELERLYKLWDSNPRQKSPMSLICRFALATGMRQSEICGLQIEDIDRRNKTAIIRDRKDPKNKQGNDQKVPLLADAWTILEPLIENRESGFAFPYQADSVSAAFTRGCQNLLPPIVDLHFHDLRHHATASFFRMGLSIPQVALLTGHKTWTMLRRYTDIKPADVHATLNMRLPK